MRDGKFRRLSHGHLAEGTARQAATDWLITEATHSLGDRGFTSAAKLEQS